MTHSSNHLRRENSRCRKNGSCIYGFPHPLTPVTWVDDEGRVHYRRRHQDDCWIVPHIPELIDELDCHIHVDIAFTAAALCYLYKYLHKGPDWTSFRIKNDSTVDEIEDYIKGRYLCSVEGMWRILGSAISTRHPSVTHLPVHLPGQNILRYNDGEHATSLLIRYLNRPPATIFDNLTYIDYFQQYVLYPWSPGDQLHEGEYLEEPIPHCPRHKVRQRLRGTKVGRIQTVPPSAGEVFYLRCLLSHQCARSFAQLRTVDDTLLPSYHEAAIHLGLFTSENEGYFAMREACESFHTPSQLRFLFARILIEGYPARPLWDDFYLDFSNDYQRSTQDEEQRMNLTLQNIQDLLRDSGRKLSHFGLPDPILRSAEVLAELEPYQHRRLQLQQSVRMAYAIMNEEQRHVYETLIQAIIQHHEHPQSIQHPHFVEGRPGRGKTFVLNVVVNHVRSQGWIPLIVGTSALAATLYEGGRTAHKMFQIPVKDVRCS